MTTEGDTSNQLCGTVEVLVNPAAGSGNGPQLCQEILLPELCRRYENVNCRITHHRGHAEMLMKRLDPCMANTVICIGGDGLIHEVLNGLNAHEGDILHNITIGVIPTGTGNALALNLGIEDAMDGIKKVLRGSIKHHDICSLSVAVAQKNEAPKTLSLKWCVIVSWGFHQRVVDDFDNAIARTLLKSFRFKLAALTNVIFFKHYKGIVTLFQSDGSQEVLEGPFTYFLATKVRELEKGFPIGTNALPADGFVDIIMVRNATRHELVEVLNAVSSGGHLEHPKLDYRKVVGFTLDFEDNNVDSRICVDGEAVSARKTITVSVDKNPLRVMA